MSLFFRVVDFANESDLRRAVKKLDGSELLGKRIRLVEVSYIYNYCTFSFVDMFGYKSQNMCC